VIEVQHLTKRYGPFTAVNDISFSVERGEILGFLGPNGAGKTTTMRVLTGYMPPSEGKAMVAGYDLAEKPIEAKRRTGYLPETPPLYPDMSVREYLLFCARIKGVPRGDRKARVAAVMERTRVTDMVDRQCGKRSQGYRQRVGLAQALLHNPEVLILDEPTAGLDPKQIHETRQLIKDLGGDHTVVLSTHILPEVSQTCTRVVIINNGKVVAVDTPDNLTSHLRGSETMYVQVDTMGADAPAALAGLAGVTRVVASGEARGSVVGLEIESEAGLDIRRELAATIVNRGWGLLELRPIRMSLEDVFLKLTTQETDAKPGGAGQAPDAPVEAAAVAEEASHE
jgi:ABC-2 type transport system ATP-binding protein